MDPKNIPTIKDSQAPKIQSDTRKLAIFQNDSDFYVIHKKAEKLAVATYMISNFFTPEEPLKWSLRKVAGELLKDTIALSSASLAIKDSLVRSLSSKLVETISLYQVAHGAGFISSMNFSIITGELEKMLELLDRRETSQVNTKSISFDEAFFTVQKPKEEDLSHTKNDSFSSRTSWLDSSIQNKTHLNVAHQTHRDSHTPHTQDFTAHTSEHHQSRVEAQVPKPSMSFIKDNQNQKDIKDKRQNTIISLVKKHRTLTIKGFTSVIRDCSEKTIQRELLALVAKGVLKKEGERRWSTYSLA